MNEKDLEFLTERIISLMQMSYNYYDLYSEDVITALAELIAENKIDKEFREVLRCC